MKLTPHFTLEELAQSDTAVRLGIDNTPPARIIDRLAILAAGLEEIRAVLKHPLHSNSGYRCEELEKVLTRKDYLAWCARRSLAPDADSWELYFERKAHPKGYACDFTCVAFGSPLKVVQTVAASPIQFDQCIMEGSWVHISFAPNMRREVMTAKFAPDGTPTYVKGV